MYSHLVHLEREDICQWQIEVGPRRGRTLVNAFTNFRELDIPRLEAMRNPGDMDCWYVEGLEAAELLADEIAQKNPGRNVLIYTLQSVTLAAAAAPSRAAYTEKGLVPK